MCALGDFLAPSASVLRQIGRHLPHHTNGNASETHPKSAHDKFKTVSKCKILKILFLDKVGYKLTGYDSK